MTDFVKGARVRLSERGCDSYLYPEASGRTGTVMEIDPNGVRHAATRALVWFDGHHFSESLPVEFLELAP